MALKKTLTIAGSDTSAGAGMQADLKHSKNSTRMAWSH